MQQFFNEVDLYILNWKGQHIKWKMQKNRMLYIK